MKIFVLVILLLLNNLFSQKMPIFPSKSNSTPLLELYELGDREKFGALRYYSNRLISNPFWLLMQNKPFFEAYAAYELINQDASFLLKQFIDQYPENIHIPQALFYAGNVYYREKKWDKAISDYEKVDVKKLTKDEQISYHFKLGLAYFNLKKYEQARVHFLAIKDIPSVYQHHAVYYYSHIHYEENQFEAALPGFMLLRNDSFYASIVPYYIAQIFYKQKKYDELINLSSSLFEKAQPKRKEEIAKMLISAFYEKKSYNAALPYVNFLDQQKSTLTREENYLMAYIYYANQQYDKAINYFKRISKQDDLLYQYAAYHLGHCFVETNQKQYALDAFYEAYQIDKDPLIQEDAMFHFVKLSYELDYHPFNKAAKVLEQYIEQYPNSSRAEEAKEWLAKILLSTENFTDAINIMKKIKVRSLEMNIAYQKAYLNLGFQQFQQRNFPEAISNLRLALNNNYERTYYAKALYWLGEAWFEQKNYDSAYVYFQRFTQYPASSRVEEYLRGFYSLGYTQIKLQKFKDAASSLTTYLDKARNEPRDLIIDAQLRLADCYFKLKEPDQALKIYESVYQKKQEQSDYALFQIAMIQGVLGKLDGKINTLKILIDNFPKSSLRPLALYEMALAYELSNQPEKAIQAHQSLISQYPTHPSKLSSLVKIGLLYRNTNQHSKAIETFKKIIEEYPSTEESRQAWIMLKNAYNKLDQLDAFFEYVAQKGSSISEQEKDSLIYQSAENKFMEGNCDEAIRGFTNYLNQFPTGIYATNARFYRAECLYGQKNFQEALTDYDIIIRTPISPFKEKALVKAATIYYNMANYEKAAEYFLTLEKIATSPQIIFDAQKKLMNLFFKTEKYEECITYAQKIQQNSLASTIDIQDAKITEAKAYIETSNYDKARELLLPLTKQKGSEIGAIATYYLAYLQFKQASYTEAENTVFDLINKYPSYEDWVARGFILLGDIYTSTGNYYQAKFAYQSIIDNYQGEDLVKEAKEKLQAVIELENN